MMAACPTCPLTASDPGLTCHARRIGSPDLCRDMALGVYDPAVLRGLSTGELTPGVPAPHPIPPPRPAISPDDPDPFVSAWLSRVRARMRPCGCPPPGDRRA